MKRAIFGAICAAATLTTPAQAAIDGCVAGTWWADISDIADMMALQMNGNARPVGGEVMMVVTPDGSYRITVRDMKINVQVPDTPAIDVTVTGYSAGSFDATEGVWLAGVADYNLVGSGEVLGQTMTIPFTSATGMFGGGTGAYTCSDSQLRLEGDPSVPMRFVRLWQRGS